MKKLTRTRVNKFTLEQAITIEELEENVSENIISIENVFNEKECIKLNNSELKLFINGVQLTHKEKDNIYRIYNECDKFIGIGVVKQGKLKRDIIV